MLNFIVLLFKFYPQAPPSLLSHSNSMMAKTTGGKKWCGVAGSNEEHKSANSNCV